MAVESLDFNSNNALSNLENESHSSQSLQTNNTLFNEISEEILFPSELNEYLRGQIRCLTSEKGRLQRCLEEKEKELVELRNQVSLTKYNNGNSTEQLATQRLGELSKRVRELTAQVERQRSKRYEAEAKLNSSQGYTGEENHTQNEEIPSVNVNSNEIQDDSKIIRDKLNQCQMRLCDFRNQNTHLKQELKLAQKVLSNEIGEDVNLAQIASNMSQGSWRGRAQQILALQQKVNELMEKIPSNQEFDKGSVKSSCTNVLAAEARASHARERSEAIAKMQTTLQENQEEFKEMKSRLEAAKARNRVLESDQNTLRQRLTTMLEKEQHDQQLIAALTTQLSAADDKNRRKNEKQEHELNEALARVNQLQQELTRELCKTRQLEETLKERDLRIEELDRRHVTEIEIAKKASCSVNNNIKLENLVNLQNSLLSAEQERNRLMELVTLLNRRISQQQAISCESEIEMLSYKNQCQRLQARITAMELEKTGGPRRRGISSSRLNLNPNPIQEDFDVNSKVELLSEQILTLRERVRRLGQEREEDLRQYIEIFGNNEDDKTDSPRTSLTDANSSFVRTVSPLNLSPNRSNTNKCEIKSSSSNKNWSVKCTSSKPNMSSSRDQSLDLKISTRNSRSMPLTNINRGKVIIKQRTTKGR